MAAPRAAATILVLAEAPGKAFEVLMIKRHSKARFMANTYVFPGGCVDEADQEYAARIRSPETLAEYRVAALRELWEETGVHFESDGRAGVGSSSPELGAAQLARLTPFAHWVTPKQEKYRYDTRFFLARATNPAAATLPVKGDPKEVDDVRWVSPQDALMLHASQDSNFRLPPPTFIIMQSLVLPSQPKGALNLISKYAGLYGSEEALQAMPRVEPVLDVGSQPIRIYMRPEWTHLPPGVHSDGPAVVHVGEGMPDLPAHQPDAPAAKL
ncbi:ndx-7 [Symbiodinium natans]|uniref:Ndx-7 protein n=1 Tax=Symbiodinium natans TaxID=878477 RepID=A0A812JQ85_9DINO|nr:ndx-7 [Symbiodinium natans]